MCSIRAQLPNSISVLRFLAGALYPWMPLELRGWAVLVGGLSDAADGWLARRLGVVSWIGALLDAIADKVFVWCILATLCGDGHLALGVCLAVLARDLVVAAVALFVGVRGSWEAFLDMPPRPLGKMTTFGQVVLMLSLLWLPVLTVPAIVLAVVLSALAGCDYLRIFHARLRAPKSG